MNDLAAGEIGVSLLGFVGAGCSWSWSFRVWFFVINVGSTKEDGGEVFIEEEEEEDEEEGY